MKKKKKKILKTIIKDLLIVMVGVGLVFSGIVILWISSFKIPTLDSFEQRKITQATKIYDRTGEILLYDVYQDIKRTVVPLEDISDNLQKATIAIEDQDFYDHIGIKPTSFMRAVFANIKTGSFGQGGSTITQQVVKLSLLTTEKDISRKLKEWVLALKLEREMNKDAILTFYLNEIPYGGTLYGAEEASQAFFGKQAKDLTVAESAYMAALPQAPTYYSPYGNNKEALESRKNLVLSNMKELGFINDEEYQTAKNEEVEFLNKPEIGIKAPHFVFYVREYLEREYGEGILETGGLKVTTTLDYEIQKVAEEKVKEYALSNKEKFDAENAALIALSPKTGEILAMVGSRDYFDKEIDGNFNVAIANNRQPGSTFKPFVYSKAFEKGYTPETVLFDVETVFSTNCVPEPRLTQDDCYVPGNYDDRFRGPMSMREALAQSINVPAVKTIYLAGVENVLSLVKSMGIQNLGDRNQYGLTLALGGGEVSLLEMSNAYAVFANEGIKHKHNSILEIRDKNDNLLEEFRLESDKIMDEEITRQISDILSDNIARTPAYGSRSLLYFGDNRDVAVKTGTTNDYRDAWIIGYTPNIVVGAWAGNNDNRPMDKKVAGQIIAPLWNSVMTEILPNLPNEKFKKPLKETDINLKPVLRGEWKGGYQTIIDKFSGLLANENTPDEARGEILSGGVHSILHWVNKENPRGPTPSNPENDYQYRNWEYAVSKWVTGNNIIIPEQDIPGDISNEHNSESLKNLQLISPEINKTYSKDELVKIEFSLEAKNPIQKVEFYLNNQYLGSTNRSPYTLNFVPNTLNIIDGKNTLKIIVTDSVFNKISKEFEVNIQ